MCRNIKPLFKFDPPATDDEVYSSALQYVRKVSGFTAPSRVNQAAFEAAVAEVAEITKGLIESLETSAPAKSRHVEAAKAKARAQARTGGSEQHDGDREDL